MQSEAKIAVVIPCFNVEKHLFDVVGSLPDFVSVIVAVDDASTDDTSGILSKIQDDRLVVVTHGENGGVGAAVRSGYKTALDLGAEVIVKMDGDGQMDPRHLPRLILPLLTGQADYTKGNRFKDIEALHTMPRTRLLGNGILSFFAKLVCGYWSIFDPTNGYTAIRSSMLRRLKLKRLSPRYFFETSMLLELAIEGAFVQDIDMPARYADEISHLNIMRVGFQFPVLLLRGLLRRFYWRYIIFDFNPGTLGILIGLPLLAFGVIFGTIHWWLSISSGIPATAGTAFLAALPIILGFQLVLMSLVLDMQAQPKAALSDSLLSTPEADRLLSPKE